LLLLVFAKEEGVAGASPGGWRFPGKPSPVPASQLPVEELPCCADSHAGAGELALQSQGVSVQGSGTHCPLIPAAPPRPRAVLQILYATDTMSPGFSQPLLSSHHGSSPKPRSLPPDGGLLVLSGEKKNKNKPPARTKHLPCLAEAA